MMVSLLLLLLLLLLLVHVVIASGVAAPDDTAPRSPSQHIPSSTATSTSMPFEDTWIENNVGLWRDTAGRPLHAHGGGMYTEGGKFYFVGAGRMTYDRPYFDSFSITLYESTDLGNWTLLSSSILNKTAFASLPPSPLINPAGPVLIARPKLIRSATTGRYSLWMGFMSKGNGVCVASSEDIAGDYQLERCFLPNGHSAIGDLTVVSESNGTEHYLIADTASHNYTGISRLGAGGLNLTDVDCLKVHCNGTSSCAMWRHDTTSGEAPAFFRHPRTGRPYLWNSHLAGWCVCSPLSVEYRAYTVCRRDAVD